MPPVPTVRDPAGGSSEPPSVTDAPGISRTSRDGAGPPYGNRAAMAMASSSRSAAVERAGAAAHHPGPAYQCARSPHEAPASARRRLAGTPAPHAVGSPHAPPSSGRRSPASSPAARRRPRRGPARRARGGRLLGARRGQLRPVRPLRRGRSPAGRLSGARSPRARARWTGAPRIASTPGATAAPPTSGPWPTTGSTRSASPVGCGSWGPRAGRRSPCSRPTGSPPRSSAASTRTAPARAARPRTSRSAVRPSTVGRPTASTWSTTVDCRRSSPSIPTPPAWCGWRSSSSAARDVGDEAAHDRAVHGGPRRTRRRLRPPGATVLESRP